jgi:UDP-N-acetylglucosamine 2-epimerase
MSFNVMMVFGTRPGVVEKAPLARVLRQWPAVRFNTCHPVLHARSSARSAAGNGV